MLVTALPERSCAGDRRFARPRLAFSLAAPLGLAFGVGSLVLVLLSGLDARQATIAVFQLVIASGFVGGGIWVLARGRATRLALLCVGVGCGLFLASWVLASEPVAYTLGLMFGLIWVATISHFVLAFPSGRLKSRGERWVVAAGYAVALVLQPLPWLFWPGDWEAACAQCPRDAALIAPHPDLAQALLALYAVTSVACGIATLAQVARVRWWRAEPLQRRAFTPVVVVLGALLALLFGEAIAEVAGLTAMAQGLDFGYPTALAALPFALFATSLRGRTARAEAIGRLTERLASVVRPEQLQCALVEALGDPSLEVAYWDEGRGAFVDGRGRELPRDGRVWTEIRHERRLLGAIVHDADAPGGSLEAVGSALALALERERLAATLRANVRELRASRARIVQAGDDARRRLERDLHDGAQQRLAALLLNLQLSRRHDGHHQPWDAVEHELAGALADLRRLARGILPPALSDQGLRAAVEDLAGRSPVDVTIDAAPDDALPEPVKIAAYFVIAEALANVTKHARAARASVRVRIARDVCRVEVADDGVGGATRAHGSGLRGLADRVEALDGRLTIISVPGEGTIVVAELPCAS